MQCLFGIRLICILLFNMSTYIAKIFNFIS